MVDKDTVLEVARLSQLHLNDANIGKVQEEFEKILNNFSKLNSVDTTDVEPMRGPFDDGAPLREDRVEKKLNSDDLFANAPEYVGHLFKVPPVV